MLKVFKRPSTWWIASCPCFRFIPEHAVPSRDVHRNVRTVQRTAADCRRRLRRRVFTASLPPPSNPPVSVATLHPAAPSAVFRGFAAEVVAPTDSHLFLLLPFPMPRSRGRSGFRNKTGIIVVNRQNRDTLRLLRDISKSSRRDSRASSRDSILGFLFV